jgi:hypothetical protein
MKSNHCRKCDDDFYNEADRESIKKTRNCLWCLKEIKYKKELVELEKKRRKLEKYKLDKESKNNIEYKYG